MANAKLNTQHDYVTLSVTFADKKRINLTTARYSEKCSARVGYDPQAMKRTFNAFAKSRKLMEQKVFKTVGDWMAHMRDVAEKATSPEHLAELFEKVIEGTPLANPKAVKAVPVPTPKVEAPKPCPHVNAYDAGEQQQPTQEKLQAAFDLVKNKKDWKARIDARINKADEAIVLAAIIHFTGTAGYTLPHPTNPDKLIVRAKGYRMGPCGDQ